MFSVGYKNHILFLYLISSPVAKRICFCFAQPTCQSTTLTFLQKCPIKLTLHVRHYLTFMQAGGGDDGTITGEEAGKPVTTDRGHITTFVKPLEVV